jgi:tetratricopeptide (TPR) repeat protein
MTRKISKPKRHNRGNRQVRTDAPQNAENSSRNNSEWSETSAPTLKTIEDARTQLSRVDYYRRSGQLENAAKACEKLVSLHPDYSGALHMLGLIHMARDAYWPALYCLVRANMLSPLDWSILTSLGQVYIGLGAPEQAITALTEAVKFNPVSDAAFYMLGQCFYNKKQYNKCIAETSKAISINTKNPDYYYLSSKAHNQLGNQNESLNLLKKSIEFDKNFIPAYVSLAYFKFDENEKMIQIEKSLINEIKSHEKAGNQSDNVDLYFGLANYYHNDTAYDKAWEWLLSANKLVSSTSSWNIDRYKKSRNELLKRATSFEEGGAEAGSNGDNVRPVFILGASRSGKTLTERLLCTLPQTHAGYENNLIELACQYASHQAGLLSIRRASSLPSALKEKFRLYYEQLLNLNCNSSGIFTTTSPGLISDVGALSQTLPNSKFVFIKRNKLDLAFRIYSKNYKNGQNMYSYDMSSIIFEIDWYESMIDTWKSKIPEKCLVINYSDIVSDTCREIEKIASFFGIACKDVDDSSVPDDSGCSIPYRKHLTAGR